MSSRYKVLAVLSVLMCLGGFQASRLRADSNQKLFASAGDGLPSGLDATGSSEGYRISALSVFSNVALHVKDNYVEPSRIDPREMLVAALNEIEREVAEVLVEDLGDGRLRVSVPGQEKLVTVNDVESLWEINLKLREIFRFFEKHLPSQKDPRAVEYAAINGALSTLDPHSVLLKPEAFAEMQTSTKGEFGGLGIVISIRAGKLVIISPLGGTPASRAGLKALDAITRIGSVSTVSMPIEEAVRQLRGPEGSKVTIWVQRKGWPEARKFTLIRERIKIESVDSELLASGVGYVRIKNFQQNTGHDLDDHIRKLEKKNKHALKGLVLDLRNNPGGLLEQAIRVSDKFLASGDIVTTVGYGNKLREPKRAQWSSSDIDLPLIVLVNKGSASASEIVAGALKNQDRALILGERTFGKGSVQVLYNFPDSSALKLTIAQYLTPGNVSIQNIGVTPDLALSPAWIDKRGVRLFYEPDSHREKNLRKHLERQGQTGTGEDAPAEPGRYELTYLYDVKKDADAEELAEGEDEEEPQNYDEFREDYAITLARELITAAGRNKRSEMLGAIETFLNERKQSEETKIAEAIQGLGVDWSAAGERIPASYADLEAKLVLVSGAEKDGHVRAGAEVKLEATVSNKGPLTLHRVRGLIQTDHPAFAGRELLFGRLGPGEKKSWSVTARLPKEASSRSDILSLRLSSDSAELSVDAKLPLATEYVPHPQFAYSYLIDDSERGDGDGLLETGEGAEFVVFVSNVGPGAADKVSLKLKSGAGEGLFLERGRVDVGDIPSGETRVGTLRFRVPKSVEVSPELPLELTIFDPATGEWLEDELSLMAQLEVTTPSKKKKGTGVAQKATQVFAAAQPGATVIATVDKNAVLEFDRQSGDYLRVELAENAYAWIPADALRVRRGARRGKLPVAYHAARRPPEIALDGELGGRVLRDSSVELSGRVYGRELRDMYVLLNEEKIFYASAPAPKVAANSAWAPPDDHAVTLPFKRTLALKEGLNKIVLVARLDERVVSYRTLFVSRMGDQSAPAVAEAQDRAPARKPN